MATKTKALTKTKNKKIKKVNEIPTDSLLKLAIDKDIDIQKLEKLIELRNKEERRLAKQEFDFHFAQMQKDFIPARKNKNVLGKTGKLLYSYCPIENIQKVYQPIITRHGFSYRWSEEIIQDGKEKRIFMFISGYGYEQENHVDIPILPENDFTNSIQQRMSSATYGQRATFKAGFGIIIEGEDDDGNDERKIKITDNEISITLDNEKKSNTIVRDTIVSPEACGHLINNLKSSQMKIEFARRLREIRKKCEDNEELLIKKLEILIKNLKEEKRHSSASFFNELDKELWQESSVTG